MSNQQYPAKVPLCGLWARTSRNGSRYYVGRLGAARVLVFENQRKQADEDPDLQVYLQESSRQAPQQSHGAKQDAAL